MLQAGDAAQEPGGNDSPVDPKASQRSSSNGATAPEAQGSSDAAKAEQLLNLDLHADETVWMGMVGHLRDWCGDASGIKLQVPPAVTSALQVNSVRLLYIFNNLQRLDVFYCSPSSPIEQGMLIASAELLNLRSLSIAGGHLRHKGLDFNVLTSLRKLHHLSVQPYSDEGLDGLEDDHVATCSRLTTLHSLDLRGSENLTDEGLQALVPLTSLTHLALLPMGVYVSREGIGAVLEAMPGLTSLSVGLHQSEQVQALRDADAIPHLRLVVNDPEMNQNTFFSTLTLCLRTNIVSLRLATLEACDATFMMALGTLHHLTELKLGVAAASGARPFTLSVSPLSALGRLRSLDLAVTQAVGLPLNVKLVSILALSWPHLTSLSLSCMAKRELAPEALGLLDNFQQLRKLCLFAPLDYTRPEDAIVDVMLPLNLRYLPQNLEQLVLECARLHDTSPAPTPTGSAGGAPPASATPTRVVGGVSASGLAPAASAPEPPLPAPVHERRSGEGAGLQRLARSASGATAWRVSGSGGAASALLPALQHLELNDCSTSDDALGGLLHGACRSLRHLELNEVVGISDEALSALRGLSALEHLVVSLSASSQGGAQAEPPPAGRGSSSGGGVRGGAGGGGALRASESGGGGGARCVTHRSLSALQHLARLQHLEWQLAAPIGRVQMEDYAMAVFTSLGSLRHLSVSLEDDRAWAPPRGGAAPAAGNGGSALGDSAGLPWKAQLRRALPLCQVTERQGVLLYNLWQDTMVTVAGPGAD